MSKTLSIQGNDPPTAIDCFAGCGGLTQGLKTAGYRVLGAIEIDAAACSVYSLNHPSVHVWNEDIRTISGRDLLRAIGLRKGELSLLAGCPPCQGFSTLRTLNGGRAVSDARNDLIEDLLRLAVDTRPRWVMMENVPGLAQDHRMKRFITGLQRSGYSVAWDVLNVADFGVPQRRKRLILTASRTCTASFATPSPKQRTVRDAIGTLPKAGSSGDALHDMPETRSPSVMARIKSIPRDGGSREQIPRKLRLRCHESTNGFKDVYGRLAWEQLAPTITTGCFNPSKGRFLHPVADRAITMREAALLQSFPRRYRFPVELGKVKIAAMIGNALPPRFITRHAKHIRQLDEAQIAKANA